MIRSPWAQPFLIGLPKVFRTIWLIYTWTFETTDNWSHREKPNLVTVITLYSTELPRHGRHHQMQAVAPVANRHSVILVMLAAVTSFRFPPSQKQSRPFETAYRYPL
jgi:hypothetical protein